MPKLTNSRYVARFAITKSDVRAAQRLRHSAFALAGGVIGVDADSYDAICTHVLVEEVATKRLACCFRMLKLDDGAEISRSYSAQYYDVSAFVSYKGPIVEIGRFCLDPQVNDCDAIRVAWAAVTQYVDENNIRMLFGCTSFSGIDATDYGHIFTQLRQKHLAPNHLFPLEKARDIRRFSDYAIEGGYDQRLALQQMPPLLRTYLAMGGWVSDHAVVDRHMNTLHVFTGIEVSAIPAKRKQLLRALSSA